MKNTSCLLEWVLKENVTLNKTKRKKENWNDFKKIVVKNNRE